MGSESDGELDATFSCMEQPPLIKQLRGILSEYPDNGQIIKELLQNAEDARASEVEIIYDERVINQSEDKKKRFRKFFKGPALCVKNNSLFEEKDWKGIKMIASSVKEDDKLKVGRFGLGFKSVFHMTDCPCILSGDRLLLVDPSRPSDQVNAEMKLKHLRRYKNMDVEAFLEAFGDHLGINESIIDQGHYPGTVFWFPLREEISKISSTLYNRDKIMDLFASFEHDSSEVLLFLCHLERVSLNINSTSGTITKVAGAEIMENKLNVRQQRKAFVQSIEDSKYPCHSALICSYKMMLRTSNREGTVDDTNWFIVHYFMGDNSSQRLRDLTQDADLGYNPLVGVAMPVTSSSTAPFEGHVFCFLPLPKEGSRLTGLPVHVNGFFSLSQNRHHLKWATNDQKHSTIKDKNILWNQTLIEECIPEAYKKLFEMLLENSRQKGNVEESVEMTYKAVPYEREVLDKWKIIPSQLHSNLSQLSFLYSLSQRRHVTIREALFATFQDLPSSLFHIKADIIDLISQMNALYVSTGQATFQKLNFYHGGMVKDLTPTILADMLRQDNRLLGSLNRSQKYSLLTYLLSSDNYNCLQGLPLLPVASGSWVTYGRGEPVFLCDVEGDKEVFPNFTDRLVIPSAELDEHLWRHFQTMAKNGCCQLKALDMYSIRDLLAQSLQNKVGHSYIITNQSQLDWFQKVWQFIDRQSVGIDYIKDLRLVPEMKGNGQWNRFEEIQLHSLTSLFLMKNNIPDEVCECFKRLQVTILPEFPSWFLKDKIGHLVYTSQNSAMNNLLGKVWTLPNRNASVNRFNSEVSTHSKDKFIEYMNRFSLDTDTVRLLQLLSMFPLGSQPSTVDGYTSVAKTSQFFADTTIPVRLPSSYIIATNGGALQLLTRLGATEVQRLSLVKMILIEMKNRRQYNQDEVDRFMMYFIDNFREFEHSQIKDLASEICFLTTDSKKVRPKDLFNPDQPLLWNLFEGQRNKFPLFLSGKNDKFRYAMKELGLKEINMVTANDIAESADLIDAWSCDNSKHSTCVTKSRALLNILNGNPALLQQWIRNTTLLNHLKKLKFIPCSTEKPKHYPTSLQWHTEKFCKPCEARITTYENECLVGSTMPLVERTFDQLLAEFGWSLSPPVEKVIDQLMNIKQCYRMQEKSNVLPLIKQVYEFLSNNVMSATVDRMKTHDLIWTGDSFEKPANVVVTLRGFYLQNLTPYIYSIPQEFIDYATLFIKVGCYPEQSVTVLIQVLDKIQETHQKKQTSEQFERDCEIVKKVIDKLAERRRELSDEDVLLPIQRQTLNQLKFYPASKCTFDKNASRYEHEEGDDTIVFVSDIIDIEAAKALGAKPLNKQILSGTESMGIEGFGQSEKLTDRIRKLISESYVDGLSVPKELVQNADDAGATVVKFLYDEREHNDARKLLLSKDMADCQGPSIVVYNNATFTDADFNNIKKLNGATKEMDGNKIGRFGLGFCAVYNLTDVPSFISKSNIVLFDPQKTYLTDALEDNSPGIKIDFKKVENRKLLRLHEDQFKPFQKLFDCDVKRLHETGYDGTLFRLPLRTADKAKESAICNVCYSRDEVCELLMKFIENAGNMLLFTQNVKHVELHHIPKNAKSVTEQVLLFTVTKKQVDPLPTSLKPHSAVLQRVTSALADNKPFREHEKYKIKVQVTPECRDLLPKLNVKQETVESAWYVVWETGLKESLTLSQQISGKRAIPLAAVAVQCNDLFNRPLRESEINSLFYTTGHMFCFLPLPIKTNLNVQINGSFDVTSDRRRLITLTDDDKNSRQNRWNEFMLSDASVNAFFSLLDHFAVNKCNEKYSFHGLWPAECLPVAKPFSDSFFKRLVSEDRSLFFGQGKWVPFSEIVFLDRDLRKHPDVGQIAFDMLSNIGHNQGKVLVDIPDHFTESLGLFHNTEASFITETEFLQLFLEQIKHGYWNGRHNERNALLVYALKSNNSEIKSQIKESCCIPVKPSGTLKKPCEVVDKIGKVSPLFALEDEVFLLDDLQHRDIIEVLLQLGMIKDELPIHILVERCSTIEQLASQSCTTCALFRCQLILQYLNGYKVRGELKENVGFMDAVANMYILPVLQRPKEWHFSWKADIFDDQNDKELKSFSSSSCKNHSKEHLCDLVLGKTASLFNQDLHKAGATVINVVDDTLLKGKYAPIHRDVFQILGIMSSLPNDVLVQHVMVLSNEYSESEEQFRQIQNILSQVYGILQSRIRTTLLDTHPSVADELQRLKDHPVVLVGNKLYIPSKVAFELEQGCQPYLVKLPDIDALTKKELYQTMGVKQRFEASDILEVLKEKKLFWKDKACDEIGTIVKLLQNLVACDECMFPENKDIVAPDIHGHLYPMHDLVIADDEFETDVVMHILHKDIAPAMAEKLGARHKQRKCFDEITKSIGVPFGQKEKLVSRIRNLLDSYPCDSSIMKELLQNADDAQATQIHFIKDYRTHPTKRIFGENCESLQGPSLCVFNDSYFTEQDLRGIHDLGEGSKRQDPSKTGQYGVGFNSVYHLTDTPSFMSNGPALPDEGILVIFDPTCKHLPGVKSDEPGIKCEIKDLKANFPDVLSGFEISNSLFEEGKGTLFRFPLRASESEVSKHTHSEKTIDKILKEMCDDLFESLLFVKHVESIKISNMTPEGLVEEYSVRTELSNEDKEKRTNFFRDIQTVCKSLKDDKSSLLKVEMREICYPMTLISSEGRNETYFVVQRFGFNNSSEIPESIVAVFRDGYLGCLPLGGVAHRISGLALPKPATGIISGTKYLLTKSDSHEEGVEDTQPSKVFCFLPIPGHIELPVHVNGHFALDDARRVLVKDGYKKEWNSCLLKNLVIPAYVRSMENWRDMNVAGFRNAKKWHSVNMHSGAYHSIFPSMRYISDPYWKYLTVELYDSILKAKQPLFPVIKSEQVLNEHENNRTDSKEEKTLVFSCEWVPLGLEGDCYNGVFNTLTPLYDNDRSHWILESVLKDLKMRIVNSPLRIKKTITDCKIGTPACTNPKAVVRFLSTYNDPEGPCEIGDINSPIESTRLRHVDNLRQLLRFIKDSKSFKQALPNLPVLLTEAKILKTFVKEVPVYCSEFCWMFPDVSDMFIHHDLFYSYPIEHLKECGYIKEFTVESFSQLIPDRFKQNLYKKQPIITWEKSVNDFPSVKWIAGFWKYIFSISDDSIEGASFSANVARFSEWAFIPVLKDGACHLVQISKAFMVIQIFSFNQNKKLEETLLKSKPATLDQSVFLKDISYISLNDIDKQIFWKVQSLITSDREPERLLEFFYHHARSVNPPSFGDSIELEDGVCILKYFSNNLENNFSKFPKVGDKLLALPLFVTLDERFVPLDDGREVFVVPVGMPVDGLRHLSQRKNVIFLKENNYLSDLYKFLSLLGKTVSSLYADMLLPNITHIPRQFWIQHIEYFRDWLFTIRLGAGQDRDHEVMINCLKTIPFIDTKTGDKRCSEFFDHNNDYFKVLCNDHEFLPDKFRDDVMISLLKILGMHHEVTDKLLIDFARRIENGQASDGSTEEKSTALTECFTSSLHEWKEDTLRKLATIRFILPFKLEDKLRAIFPPKEEGVQLICMQGAVELTHMALCWSTLHILPFDITQEYHKQLGIYTEPPLLAVLKHCQNVSTELKEKLESAVERNDYITHTGILMLALYTFLQKHADKALVKDMLLKFPMIHLPSKDKLVTAEDIVIDISALQVVEPYLFKAPVEYGQFFDLFQALGTSKVVKCYHYQNILNSIARQAEDETELAVHELRTVQQTLDCLCSVLEDKSSREFSKHKLYLPDANKVMRCSTEVVIVDNRYIKKRMAEVNEIVYFIGFNKLELKNVDPWLFVNSLPEKLRPKLITKIVKERFDEDCVNVVHNSSLATRITSFIHSEEFVRGICRILKFHYDSEGRQFDPVKDVDTITQSILKVNVLEVSELQTYLLYKDNIVNGSHRSKICFYQDSGDGTVNVYIKLTGSNLISLICRPNGLTRAIVKYTGLPSDQDLMVVSILRTMVDDGDISMILDEEKYPPLDSNINLDRHSVFPRPGTYVEEKFHPFLEHALDSFDRHEFLNVAMELEDKGLDTDTENLEEEISPIYIYVHIEEALNPDTENPSLVNMKYLVDVGADENIEVAGYRLYRFVRPRKTTKTLTQYTGKTPQEFLPFDENCRRLREQLRDAWTLPDTERRRIIRRLLFHWHPDRNPGSEEYASRMFNYIKQSVLRLEQTGTLDDEDETDGHQSDFSRSNFNSMFSNLNRRAQTHARAYRDNLDEYNTNQRSGNYSHSSAYSVETKDSGEARRWMRQAKSDFQGATRFLPEAGVHDQRTFNWICYMCHQASEKALKAACYAKNANMVSLKDHSLTQPASVLSSAITTLAQQLENHLGFHTRMRYPERGDRQRIPADIYTKDQAEVAVQIAKQIIEASDDFIP